MKKVTKEDFIKAFKEGYTYKEMAKKFSVSKGTIKNYVKKLGLHRGKGNRTNHEDIKSFNF